MAGILARNDQYLEQVMKVHAPRYFAMLNNAVMIEGTKTYEGGVPGQALKYYQYLQQLELPDCPIALSLTAEQNTALHKTTAELISLDEFLEQAYRDGTILSEDFLDQFIQKISSGCDSKGFCYASSGWQNNNGGHFAGLKIRRMENGHYALSMINHGDGIRYHRELSRSGEKVKRCYQSEEFEVDLKSDKGRELLKRLTELRYDRLRDLDKKDIIKAYDADDLYGLLAVNGKKLDSLTKLDDKAVTPQRTGTCSTTNVHAVARDVLIDLDANFETRKRYHFVIKLRSLIAAYYQYRQGNFPRELLIEALHEFETRTNKYAKTILTDAEVIYCGELQAEIQQRLKVDTEQELETRCAEHAFPDMSGEVPAAVDLLLDAKPFEMPEAETPKQTKKRVEGAFIPEDIKPEQVAELLQFDEKEDLPFDRMYQIISALPHCSGEASDEFWDKVPIEIISQLHKILENRKDSTGVENYSDKSKAMALIIYDITAQLSSRVEALKLSETYTLGLDDVFTHDTYPTDPVAYYSIKRVMNNFAKRNQDKQRVFSNIVDPKDSGNDSSIHYVIRVLMNKQQRNRLLNKMGKTQATEKELFQYLMEKMHILNLRDERRGDNSEDEHVLDKVVRDVLGIALTAQHYGSHEESYSYDKVNDLFYVSHNQYWSELKRKKALPTLEVAKSLPSERCGQAEFEDVSEATIYHPKAQLDKLRQEHEERGKSAKVREHPYQLYITGSINPDGHVWDFTPEQQQLFEELDEELRHLQATPHLQIARTMTWIKNNTAKLAYGKVREQLHRMLFQFGRLDEALAHNPQNVLTVIIESLENSFNQCHTDSEINLDALYWLCNLEGELKEFIEVTAALYQIDLSDFSWPNYAHLLIHVINTTEDSDIKSKLASYIVRNSYPENITTENAILALVARMIANLGGASDLSDTHWQTICPKVIEVIERDNKAALENLQKLLADHLKLPDQDWQYVDGVLSSKDGDYVIDLVNGKLNIEKTENIKERTNKTIAQNQELFAHLGLTARNITLLHADSWKADPRLPLAKEPTVERDDGVTVIRSEARRILKSSDGQWEFAFIEKSSNQGRLYQILSVYHMMNLQGKESKFKWLNAEELREFFKEVANPFESNPLATRHYEYWQSAEDPDFLFVKQKNNGRVYAYSRQHPTIQELQQDTNGQWQLGRNRLLNLCQPSSELETEWTERLKPMVGVQNVRIPVHLDEQGSAHVESVEFLSLGLSFKEGDHQKLMCQQRPGYFLSPKKSLPALNGLSNVVLLENASGQKRVVIPAFALNKGEKNNALNFDNIIDTTTLINSNKPFYSYHLDKHNQLVANSSEANLYLAIVYRSLGDFKNAMKYLERAKTYKNINRETLNIAMQVLNRKMVSPAGAAFDLKLACFLQEHQEKWSRDSEQKFEPAELPKTWNAWVKSQLVFYHKSYSYYKADVANLQSYCRLTKAELTNLSKVVGGPPRSFVEQASRTQLLNQHLEKVSRVPYQFIHTDSSWHQLWGRVKHFRLSNKGLTKDYESLRCYANGKNHSPVLNYLINYIEELFDDAISQDPDKTEKLKQRLFSLLHTQDEQQDYVYALIAVLLYANKYPELFADFEKPGEKYQEEADTSGKKYKSIANLNYKIALICSIGDVFYRNREQLKEEVYYFFDVAPVATTPTIEQSQASDFRSQSMTFAIGAVEHQAAYEKPFNDIYKEFFTDETVPIVTHEFQLQSERLDKENLLEQRLFGQLEQGHQDNQDVEKKQKKVYTLNPEVSLEQLKARLAQAAEYDSDKYQELEAKLLRLANQTPLDNPDASESDKAIAHNLLLARASEQRPAITIADLFYALQKQDPQQLTQQNPFLTQEVITECFGLLEDYALLHSRYDQTRAILQDLSDKNCFEDLKPHEVHELATNLDKQRHYDIKAFPELLMYEYATGRMLREDQVDTLKEIITLMESRSTKRNEMHHALLQFAAGGGKTSVLIPILAQRFARKGFLPVIFNTPELYNIGLQDIPNNLRQSFQQNMEVIERDLDHVWTRDELRKLLDDLKRWKSEGKCVLLKPTTWHSINITMKMNYIHSEKSSDNYLLYSSALRVLEFFKDESIKLEDECHIISDPLQKSIKTYGKDIPLPKNQLKLVACFYDYLMGDEQGSESIAALAGIKSQRKHPLSKEELSNLQTSLADAMTKEKMFHHDTFSRHQLFVYLTDASRKKPQWLLDLRNSENKEDKELAESIVLARAFLQTHLPHILTLQLRKDYGYSIHPGDLTAAPKHEGKDVTAHFADHTLVSAMTIQLYKQRGLSPEHVGLLLDQLAKEHQEERKWNLDFSKPTQAETILLEIIPEGYDFHCMLDLTAGVRSKLAVDPSFYKSKVVIDRFLNEFALPQIKLPSYRISSSASELQAGFKRSLLLSATPGLPEMYAAFLEIDENHCFLEHAFEAQVVDTLLGQDNQGLVLLDEIATPNDFFKQIPDDLLARMTTVIDRGALLTHFEVEKFINAYLKLDNAPTKTSAFFLKEKLHVKSKESHIGDLTIDGAGLLESLKAQGIDPERFLLFLFLDLSKSTGTDFKRFYDDHAGLTMGLGQTVTETVQAAMRERGLLKEHGQSITWLMFQSLYHEIHPESEKFDPRNLFYWMIKNEAKAVESKLINRAYQGIEQAFTEIMLTRDEGKEKLEQKQPMSPWDIYEIESTAENSEKVLKDYIQDLMKQYDLKQDDIPAHVQQRLDKIVAQTKVLIAQLDNPRKTQLGNEVQQEQKEHVKEDAKTQQQQQQRMMTKLDQASDFVFELERYNHATDNLTSIFDAESTRYQKLVLPDCDGIAFPELRFCQQHFKAIDTHEDSDELTQLKPIKMLLLRRDPDGKVNYLAVTAAGAEYYSILLNQQSFLPNTSSYSLMSIEGDILQTSDNSNIHEFKQQISGDANDEMLAYVSVLNGNISNPTILSHLIEKQQWREKDFNKIADAVTEVHVSRTPVKLHNNKALAECCGWSSQEDSATQQRYRYREEARPLTKRQPLNARTEALANRMTTTSRPVCEPQTALEGYVFGRTPDPRVKYVGDRQKENLLLHLVS